MSVLYSLTIIRPMGPSIKYVTLFLANFYPPPPVTLCHTSRDPPAKYVTNLGPPRFLVGLVHKTRTKAPCKNSSLNCSWGFLSGGFCQGGLLSGRFYPGWFLSIPLSVRMHLLQQKVKHHFKCHVSYVR